MEKIHNFICMKQTSNFICIEIYNENIYWDMIHFTVRLSNIPVSNWATQSIPPDLLHRTYMCEMKSMIDIRTVLKAIPHIALLCCLI